VGFPSFVGVFSFFPGGVTFAVGEFVIRKHLGCVLAGVFAASFLVGAQSVQAGPISFDFTGAQGGPMGMVGAAGNVRTFTAGSVTLSVTSWGLTFGALDDALEAARLGRWTTGLGSCNAEEVPCGDPAHQVDNLGADDWLLFLFSEPVDISSVRVDPHGVFDRDVSYYVGNVAMPLDLTGVGYAGLGALGFGPLFSDVSTPSGAFRDVAIAGGLVNAMLLGGYQDETDDFFKVRGLSAVTVPEPGSLLLLLAGATAIAGSRRRRAVAL
jgi:hypothetical protein